jgi:hypothetical protein
VAGARMKSTAMGLAIQLRYSEFLQLMDVDGSDLQHLFFFVFSYFKVVLVLEW